MPNETEMTINLSNHIFNRLHTLAVKCTSPADIRINLAVKRLIDDVDSMREFRAGTIKLE